MKCTKDLSITITAPFECPASDFYTLTSSSPRCLVRESHLGSSPFYCYRRSIGSAPQSMQITIGFGEAGMGGAMDTYLYLLYAIGPADSMSTWIEFEHLTFPDDLMVGMTIRVVAGTGTGIERTIVANRSNIIVLDSVVPGGLDDTSQIEFYDQTGRYLGNNVETFGNFCHSRTILYYHDKNWPNNALALLMLVADSGPFVGNEYQIFGNFANALLLTNDTSDFMDTTWTFLAVVAQDDDSGPGANSQIKITIPFTGDFIAEGTTFSPGETGDVEMRFDCTDQLPLVAHWDSSKSYGMMLGTTVMSFRDRSTYATAWEWDFGDGSPLSHEQNPDHVFIDYPVNLANCKASNVKLTVTRDAATASYEDTIGVQHKLRIAGYDVGFFTLSGPLACEPCSGGSLAAWDGILWPVLAPCRWGPIMYTTATGDQCNGIYLIVTGNRFYLHLQCTVNGAPPVQHISTYEKDVDDVHDPVGTYSLITPDQIIGPATLTIELA